MTTKAWRRASLRWPPTPDQWQALQQDLDYVYRWIRDLQANGGGGSSSSADLSNLDADNLTSGTVPAARMPALTGDVTSSVGTVATTLAASGVTAGTFGDSTHVAQVTVDAKGRVTAAANVSLGTGTAVYAASGYRATNQTLTHNTATAISLSTEHYDDGGLANFGTNATRLTVPTGGDGVYTVKGQIALGTGFQGVALLQLAKNGTVFASNTYVGADLASGTEYHDITADVSAVATDYFEFKVTLVLAAGSGTFDVVGGTANTLFQAGLVSPMTVPTGTFIKADGTVPLTADWAVGSHKLTGLTDPASAQDAATKAYVDSHGGGSLVLLESHVASASASLDFTTRNATGQSGATFQSDFDEYELHLVSIVPATNAAALMLRMSTDGGTSYDSTSGHYSWQVFAMAFNASGANGSTSDTAIKIFNDMNSASKISQSARLRIYSPLSTTLYKLVEGTGHETDSSRTTDSLGVMIAGKFLVDASAVNAFRLLASSGNLASGGAYLYGVKKS